MDTTPALSLTVPGIPETQGSLRHVGHGRLISQNEKPLKHWRGLVTVAAGQAWAGQAPLDEPVSLELVFRLPRPASHYRTGRNAHLLRATAPVFPHKRKDLDKLARAILDALTLACVYVDDSRVVSLDTAKVYATGQEPAGVTVRLRTL